MFALANSGCLLIAAGAAGGGGAACYAYYKGRVCDTYHAGLDDTVAATKAALADLGMPLLSEEHDKATASLVSRTADGDKVRIKLDLQVSRIPADQVQTWVGVRVATFGDQTVSNRLLDQIGFHLTPIPPPASPGQRVVPIPTGTPGGPPAQLLQPAGAQAQTPAPPLLPPEPTPQS
jgi:hypothetical protein